VFRFHSPVLELRDVGNPTVGAARVAHWALVADEAFPGGYEEVFAHESVGRRRDVLVEQFIGPAGANLAVAVVIPPITVIGTAAAALCPLWPSGAQLLIGFTGPELWWLLRATGWPPVSWRMSRARTTAALRG